ncbi:MAG: hypothetical protein JWN70_6289 [Planctomycetaceae bacterium]|nr:hypothetical protein [Planctomycetaceae bacterium]
MIDMTYQLRTFPTPRPTSLVAIAIVLWIGWPLHAADDVRSSVGINLRLIEAGRFEMGEHDLGPGFLKDHSDFQTADVRPVHPVVLTKPFYLATTEVTVGQFKQFVADTGYKTSAEINATGGVGWDPKPPADNPRGVGTFRDGGGFNWKQPGFDQEDSHPVTGVSFADAKAFCAWLSKKEGVKYRLPTEAEWEYAARAGTESYFSFGDAYRGVIQRFANIGNVELELAFPDRVRRQWLVDVKVDPADKHVFTAPVGSYHANPWGLFDTYGNVWEWCEDDYLDTAYAPYVSQNYQQVRKRAIDPLNTEKWSNQGEWRVIRGGSWFNAPIQCRSSCRGYFEATDAACYIGFRVARDAPDADVAAAKQRFDQSEAARMTVERLADRIQERRTGRLTIDVNLQQKELTEEFLKALEALDEPVDLHLNASYKLLATQLRELGRIPQLKGLSINGADKTVADADLAMLSNHPQLEWLQLSGVPQLTNEVLQHLRKMERLEFLQLDGTAITDDGLQQLRELKRLKSLRLNGTASRGLVLARFQGSPLERFSCDHLSDEGARLLSKFPKLVEVSVGGSPITGVGLADIARLPSLQSLALAGCRELKDADFAVLGNIYGLSTVYLINTAAGDLAAQGLARLNNVRDLHIGSQQLTDAGVRKLCEIVSLHSLTINSDAVNLTDEAFVDLWRLTNLYGMTMSAPHVTGSSLSAIDELRRLEWMNLEGESISDAALKHVAKSETLKRLVIGSGQKGGPAGLTDAGLLHLAKASQLTSVSVIRRGTQLTDNGAAELRKLRPALSVDVRN